MPERNCAILSQSRSVRGKLRAPFRRPARGNGERCRIGWRVTVWDKGLSAGVAAFRSCPGRTGPWPGRRGTGPSAALGAIRRVPAASDDDPRRTVTLPRPGAGMACTGRSDGLRVAEIGLDPPWHPCRFAAIPFQSAPDSRYRLGRRGGRDRRVPEGRSARHRPEGKNARAVHRAVRTGLARQDRPDTWRDHGNGCLCTGRGIRPDGRRLPRLCHANSGDASSSTGARLGP